MGFLDKKYLCQLTLKHTNSPPKTIILCTPITNQISIKISAEFHNKNLQFFTKENLNLYQFSYWNQRNFWNVL